MKFPIHTHEKILHLYRFGNYPPYECIEMEDYLRGWRLDYRFFLPNPLRPPNSFRDEITPMINKAYERCKVQPGFSRFKNTG
jgi:hypothetical protein